MNDLHEALFRLHDITRILREPGGCDWDRAQDLFSMREYLLEEAAEVIDAVNRRDEAGLKEELGDLLFLVFFFARLSEEAGAFHLGDVARGMSTKLVRRHPHVFGDVKVAGVGEIVTNWERIKEAEKAEKAGEGAERGESPSVLRDTKKFLPALARAYKIQEKVAAVGFDWPDTAGVLAKIREEIGELEAEMAASGSPAPALTEAPVSADEAAARRDRLEDEAGDLLFATVNLLRHLKIHPEAALHRSSEKFARRFRAVEAALAVEGRAPAGASLAEMDRLWDEVKLRERAPGDGAE